MGPAEITPTALAAIALVCGLWLALAVWLVIRGVRGSAAGRNASIDRERSRALLASGPAVPLVVLDDGIIEAGDRLAGQLGLGESPAYLGSLSAGDAGLSADDLDRLAIAVRDSAATGSPISLSVRAQGSGRVLRLTGGPAPAPFPGRSVILWLVDATDVEERSGALSSEVDRLTTALDALSALIEAAPFPVWHRGPDLRLAMVNSAYVAAVEAEDAMAVIKAGIELVDESEGRTPLSQAALVREKGEPVARTVPATIAGERRTMTVVEVPIGAKAVAGYAVDVEDREQARADLARFFRAQRDMLDRLSAGVAQFSRDRHLTFSNQPFARLFSLRPDFLADSPEFNRVLDAMRESGNLPEVRDYPDWKGERGRWFTSGLAAVEEDWLLPQGSHLRVVAQPLPDGGLLLIFEDRTEQIQLASARDTLLRVRTATFDNLFEAVGVFASDGRLHLWNNRFRLLWQFEEEQLAAHPRVDALVPHIGAKLKNPSHAGLVRELVRSATVERKQRSGRVSLVDGREFEFAAVPLPDGNALFTMLDVTSSRMVESALRERNEALEEGDRIRTAFVSNMSYELRTPLTSIGGLRGDARGRLCGRALADCLGLCDLDHGIGCPAQRADRQCPRPHSKRERKPAACGGAGRPGRIVRRCRRRPRAPRGGAGHRLRPKPRLFGGRGHRGPPPARPGDRQCSPQCAPAYGGRRAGPAPRGRRCGGGCDHRLRQWRRDCPGRAGPRVRPLSPQHERLRRDAARRSGWACRLRASSSKRMAARSSSIPSWGRGRPSRSACRAYPSSNDPAGQRRSHRGARRSPG
jgi:PAS domain-containing protein